MNVSMNIADKAGFYREIRRVLRPGGWLVLSERAFGARSPAMVERGEKPPNRAVALVHGAAAAEIGANMGRALLEGRVIPIEVLARKRA